MSGTQASAPRVAVAIVSFNERVLLDACLRSLQDDAASGRAEVWVVDNASTDGSVEHVRAEFPWAQVIGSDTNLGYGPAVNLVAGRTRSEWIAPANQDIVLEPGTLAQLLSAGDDHPEAGAIAPRLIGDDGEAQHSVNPFPTVWLTLLFNLGLHRIFPALADRLCLAGGWRPERSRLVDWALGAFLLVRRRAFDQAGGFDDSMWMYAEDLDLGWRLRKAGWRTWYEAPAVVRHRGSVSAKKAFGDEIEARFMRASYSWMARRRGVAVTWVVALLNLIGAAVRWTAASVAARGRPARFSASRDIYARWTRAHLSGLRAWR